MNRSNEVAILDNGLISTMQKGGPYATMENIKNSLTNYYFHNETRGITSANGARDGVKTLKQINIERELLKNVIKADSLEKQNGYVTLLGTNKTYDDKTINLQEAEFLIKKLIGEMPMEAVVYVLKQNPVLFDQAFESFVTKRYYNSSYGIDRLDNVEMIDTYNQYLFDKIDSYYDEKLGNNNGIAM